jgi:hypothetical protein
MTDSQNKNITIKIIAPDAHQVLRSLRAIESLTPVYLESGIKQNDKDTNKHVFLTLPINWFLAREQELIKADLGQSSQEQAQTATATTI